MNDIIQLLPDSVANQIAAGEVIQRPASVVKELMENAIDADATSIQVILKDAGRTLIQVIDNGKGMSATDARMAFERHATSKIRRADDLFSLHTMGFRGEALASIAAIAQVELRTRRTDDEVGTLIALSGCEVERQEPVSCAVGSNFQVKNIFFNVPARRKFLKSNQTELSNIITEFERVALVNPQVSFSLVHNDNEILNLPAANLRQRIVNTFGKSLNQQLLSVEVDTDLISVSGYIGRPEAARKRNALQYFFVNGRYMRHPYFHKAVMQSYEQLIPAGEQPNYFLYFNVDPANIDVNIHPTKTEIKFENEQFLWQIISAAVKEALGKFSAVPSIDFDVADAPDIPLYNQDTPVDVAQPKPKFDSGYNPFNTPSGAAYRGYPPQPSASRRPDPDWQKLYGGDPAAAFSASGPASSKPATPSKLNTPQPTVEGEEPIGFEGDPDYFHTDAIFPALTGEPYDADAPAGTPFEGGELLASKVSAPDAPSYPVAEPMPSAVGSSGPMLSAVGNPTSEPVEASMFGSPKNCEGEHYQFKGRYILTSVKSGLMMIDQHRAHLRVLFDHYMEQISAKRGVSQGVLFPDIVSFAPADVPVLESILPDLQFVGFDLSNMGGCAYAINGVPAGIDGVDIRELLNQMIATAKEKGRDVKTDLHEMIALSLAEVAAIPYGRSLGMDEMEKLIDDLFATGQPNFTPDGRKILSVVTNDEIAGRFK